MFKKVSINFRLIIAPPLFSKKDFAIQLVRYLTHARFCTLVMLVSVKVGRDNPTLEALFRKASGTEKLKIG